MTIYSVFELKQIDIDKLSGILFEIAFRFRTGFAWAIAIALLAGAIAPLSALYAQPAQGSAPQGPAVDVVARPCKSIPIDAKPSKGANKNKKHKLADEDADPSGACLEVHSTAIEVQEYLQAQGREQKWNLMDERVTENAWTLSRKLEKEELLRYTKPDASADRVDWTSGVAFIQVTTTEIDGGFVRVQVYARFQGHGQNPDRFAPPKDTWPLNSNSTFENELISLLEKHFKNTP